MVSEYRLTQTRVCSAVSGSPLVTEEALDGMLYLPEVVQRQIQLSSNAAENQLLRSEFYYEQVWRQRLNISLMIDFSRTGGVVVIAFMIRLA